MRIRDTSSQFRVPMHVYKRRTVLVFCRSNVVPAPAVSPLDNPALPVFPIVLKDCPWDCFAGAGKARCCRETDFLIVRSSINFETTLIHRVLKTRAAEIRYEIRFAVETTALTKKFVHLCSWTAQMDKWS